MNTPYYILFSLYIVEFIILIFFCKRPTNKTHIKICEYLMYITLISVLGIICFHISSSVLKYINITLQLISMYFVYSGVRKICKELDVKRGFMVGRFQPFHTGHLYVIEEALKHVDILYICIGSYDQSNTDRNPLGGNLRYIMLSDALSKYIGEGRVVLVPMADLKGENNNNTDWGDHLMNGMRFYTDILPTYTFGGEEVCRSNWFSQDILKTLKVIELPKTPISATEIREKIVNGEDVYGYLPFSKDISDRVIEGVKKQKGVL